MGLASKLRANAAATGGVVGSTAPQAGAFNPSASYGQPPAPGGYAQQPSMGGYAQQTSMAPPATFGQQPSMGGYAQQPSMGGYAQPPAAAAGYPPQQQGSFAAPPQQSYEYAQASGGAPPQARVGAGSGSILDKLRMCVQHNKLERFYPEQVLQQVASQCEAKKPQVEAMAAKWRLGSTIAMDLYQLALYDVILLCDDSGSMAMEDRGERIEDLKMTLTYVAEATSLFDRDGICVRFLNSPTEGNGVVDPAQVQQLVSQVRFSGLTPLGTALENKILQPFYFSAMRQNSFTKPLLVIVLTDGQPQGEPITKVVDVIGQAWQQFQGQGLAISFAQIGKDQGAQRFLHELDVNRSFGSIVDCTSSFELEQEELSRKNLNLEPEQWIAKLLLGAIDPSYDAMDE